MQRTALIVVCLVAVASASCVVGRFDVGRIPANSQIAFQANKWLPADTYWTFNMCNKNATTEPDTNGGNGACSIPSYGVMGGCNGAKLNGNCYIFTERNPWKLLPDGNGVQTTFFAPPSKTCAYGGSHATVTITCGRQALANVAAGGFPSPNHNPIMQFVSKYVC
jgi:hypothetical protein